MFNTFLSKNLFNVAFREDDNRARIGNTAANLSIDQDIAMSKLRREKPTKIGIKTTGKKLEGIVNILSPY